MRCNEDPNGQDRALERVGEARLWGEHNPLGETGKGERRSGQIFLPKVVQTC
jgi:hypothetical protein